MRAVFLSVENSNRRQMVEAFARMAGIEAYRAWLIIIGCRQPEGNRSHE